MRGVVRLVLVVIVLALLGLPLDAEAGRKGTFVYVHDNDGPRIFAFELARDGTLTQVAGSPFTTTADGTNCGGNCDSLSYSKKRKMLFVGTADGLAVWSVAKDGALTEVAGSPFDVGASRLFGTSVLERGKRVFVFAGDFSGDNVHVWEIAKDGTATPVAGSPFDAGNGALGTAVAKKVLAVANQSDASLSSYSIAKDGTLTPAAGSPLSVGDGVWTTQAGPKGKHVLLGNSTAGVHVLAVDKKTGALSEVAGSPFDTGLNDAENGISISPKRIGVAFDFSDQVRALRVGKDGTLKFLGTDPVDLGVAGVNGHDITKNGKILVVGAHDSDVVASYRVDKKSGAITPLDSVDLSAADPSSVDDVLIVQR